MLQEQAERDVRHDLPTIEATEPALDRKVEFLSKVDSYPHPVSKVIRRETHMSWVFVAGDRVYKLKKPVRFRYLDFSTLQRREVACRAELRLNRRLAPDVYLEVVPLTITPRGLSLGENATVIDWLVVMRRLDERQTLEHAIEEQCVERWQLDVLAETLAQFYRRARATLVRGRLSRLRRPRTGHHPGLRPLAISVAATRSAELSRMSACYAFPLSRLSTFGDIIR